MVILGRYGYINRKVINMYMTSLHSNVVLLEFTLVTYI